MHVLVLCSPTEIHFQSATTLGTEGQQLMLCITLETTLEGGIINPLTVTLNISVEGGTDFMSIASVAYYCSHMPHVQLASMFDDQEPIYIFYRWCFSK